MKIYKYPIPVEDYFTIKMPVGAEILSFQCQNNSMNIWAVISPNLPTEIRKFSIIGTGHNIDIQVLKKFIGTVQLMDGDCVWHLFELK